MNGKEASMRAGEASKSQSQMELIADTSGSSSSDDKPKLGEKSSIRVSESRAKGKTQSRITTTGPAPPTDDLEHGMSRGQHDVCPACADFVRYC